jgi:hypothetical protein
MVNFIPKVELSGEHAGEILSFLQLRTQLRSAREHGGESWRNDANPGDIELYCMMQQWFYTQTGKNCGEGFVHGFKEIRYSEPEVLDFIVEAFPNCKIILNFRLQLEVQRHSGFFDQSKDTIRNLYRTTSSLVDWGKKNSNVSFLFPLEHFNPTNFTKLYGWLGFKNCEAHAVIQTNAAQNGSYTPISEFPSKKYVSCS